MNSGKWLKAESFFKTESEVRSFDTLEVCALSVATPIDRDETLVVDGSACCRATIDN